MKARLQKIQESNPDITLEEWGLQAYIGEALKKRIMDAPIIRINDKTYSGVIDEETILASLENTQPY
jgi:hypothetical protein